MSDLFREPPEGVERRPVTYASRVLMGGPVVLVTTSYRGQHNVMPLAWHAPLSSDPPLIGISIEQSRYSVDMISHSQEFALNFPTWPLLHHVQYLGAMSGGRIDKFEATQLETFTASRVSAPLIEGCAAWIECEVQQVVPIGDHVLFVGLPVAVHVDRESFDERWLVAAEEKRPLHFLGGNLYSHLGRVMEARSPARGDAPERFLAERLAEELELTQEARERRAELLGQLHEEIEQGKAVDLAALSAETLPEFARRVQILGPGAPEGSPPAP
jgi:flavin reductase (DIM6/NTAB) family NADH-FMN oxidoreductase RutF